MNNKYFVVELNAKRIANTTSPTFSHHAKPMDIPSSKVHSIFSLLQC